MFPFKTDFRKELIILLLTSILLGTLLVILGGYLTNNYFVQMVSGLIGDYGEYDLLFTISSDQEEIAIQEIKNIAADNLAGSSFKEGPKVAGSSNYLLKLPAEYKNEETYIKLGSYFADIPGLLSRTIMTEPRLSVRGFRGASRPFLRSQIEEIPGIDFLYSASGGLDIIVESPELVVEVQEEIEQILDQYKMLEIRYPLNYKVENLTELRAELIKMISEEGIEVVDVTTNSDTERLTLLNSLKQMRSFLISYATKIIIPLENSANLAVGSRLRAVAEDGRELSLEVIANEGGQLVALIQDGELSAEISELEVYYQDRGEQPGAWLGQGQVNNPRQDLALALDRLNEITPNLKVFLEQSEELINYSENLRNDLARVTQGLQQLETTSANLDNVLQEWQQQGISKFLEELNLTLDDIKSNVGDISDIQADLIVTSNKLKEGAGLLEEKLIYIPRNNEFYQQLTELKDLFLQVADGLDENYDLVTSRLEDMDPVINSIGGWQEKITSLLKVEDSLNNGADWEKVAEVIGGIDETVKTIDTQQIEANLTSIQEILIELKTNQLPVIIQQLSYIQESLPDLKEAEIIETINLIDSYIAGQVIPGDQIQLLLEDGYDSEELLAKVQDIIQDPSVSFIEMDAGILQVNARGEVFNVLRQVKAVISTIIALIFTLLLMILDQSLIISLINLNGGKGYLYGFFVSGFIFSSIYYLSGINFPYLDFKTNILIGGILGLLIASLSRMLNPIKKEEWEAGKALGFSPAEIMREIVIPAGKPGLLYLLNYPKMIFK